MFDRKLEGVRLWALKMITFVLLGVLILYKVRDILDIPDEYDAGNGSGLKAVHNYPNSFNAIIVGPSTGVFNIQGQELYEKYGISTVSVSTGAQPTFLSYYILLEALEYQNPEVVIFDAANLVYNENEIYGFVKAKNPVHYVLDEFNSVLIKYEALQEASQYYENIDYWSYFSKFYAHHTSWKNLTKKHFTTTNKSGANGNRVAFGIMEDVEDVYLNGEKEEDIVLPEHNLKYFDKIVELCKEKNVELILTTSYADLTKGEERELIKLSEEYNLDYLNINEHREDIGFDINISINDSSHLNLYAAIQWTDYLGQYLVDNYEFSEIKNPPAASEELRKIYEEQVEHMNNKIKLMSQVDFYSYMEELINIDRENNVICISVYDAAEASLSPYGMSLINELGIESNMMGLFKPSFAAIVSGDNIKEGVSVDGGVHIKEYIDKVSYVVESGNAASGLTYGIKINGYEYGQAIRGINIVVYNKFLNEVVSVASFDTWAIDNPMKMRISTTNSVHKQYEVAPNVWEDVE